MALIKEKEGKYTTGDWLHNFQEVDERLDANTLDLSNAQRHKVTTDDGKTFDAIEDGGITDMDNLVSTGYHFISDVDAVSNVPATTGDCAVCMVLARGVVGGYLQPLTQIMYYLDGSGSFYKRDYTGAWTAWKSGASKTYVDAAITAVSASIDSKLGKFDTAVDSDMLGGKDLFTIEDERNTAISDAIAAITAAEISETGYGDVQAAIDAHESSIFGLTDMISALQAESIAENNFGNVQGAFDNIIALIDDNYNYFDVLIANLQADSVGESNYGNVQAAIDDILATLDDLSTSSGETSAEFVAEANYGDVQAAINSLIDQILLQSDASYILESGGYGTVQGAINNLRDRVTARGAGAIGDLDYLTEQGVFQFNMADVEHHVSDYEEFPYDFGRITVDEIPGGGLLSQKLTIVNVDGANWRTSAIHERFWNGSTWCDWTRIF